MTFSSHINKYPVLSNDETVSLLQEYKNTQSVSVRNKLVNHNLRLVIKSAYSFKYSNKEELIQEGILGLIRGIEKFDLSKNVPLSNYICLWIKAFMMRFLTLNSYPIKIGTSLNQRKILFKLQKTKEKFLNQGKEISYEALASELGVDVESVKSTDEVMNGMFISLNKTNFSSTRGVRDLLNEINESAQVLNSSIKTPYDSFKNEELNSKVKNLLPIYLNSLTDRESEIFKRRLLLDHKETFEVIGKDLGLARQRIQQIEAELKTNFKKFLKRNNIENYI